MKLLFLTPHYGTLGGVRLIVDALSRAARDGHHDVAAVVDDARSATIPATEIPLYPFPARSRDIRRLRRFGQRFPSTMLRLVRTIRRVAPDVVSIHCTRHFAPYVSLLRGASGIPQVLSLQEGAIPAGTPENRGLFRMLVRAVDAVAACSTETARYATAVAGTRRMHVVPNGYDRAEFGPGPAYPHPRPYLLGIGRLEEQKGFDLLIRGLARRGHDGVDLLLAGAGRRHAARPRSGEGEGAAGRPFFLRATDRVTTLALYRGARVVACPSRFEGFPLVCIEALAARRVVVASAVNGIPDLIRHEETGLLVPPDDVDALAAALRRVLDAPDAGSDLGSRGHALVERLYSWDVTAGSYLGLCAEVAAGAGNRLELDP